jgi:hypothetical protein
MSGVRGPKDGLVNMWAFEVDQKDKITGYFQIISRTGDAYVVRYNCLEKSDLSGIRCLKRKDILVHPRLFLTHFELHAAMKDHEHQRVVEFWNKRFQAKRELVLAQMAQEDPGSQVGLH